MHRIPALIGLSILCAPLLGGACAMAGECVLDDMQGDATLWGQGCRTVPSPAAADTRALRWALDETPAIGREVAVRGSGFRTIIIDMTSERMTGDRVRLSLHAPDAANRYEVTFSVDWRGRNVLQLEPHCFSAVGRPRGLDAIRRVELARADTQFGGSALTLSRMALTTDNCVNAAGPNLDLLDAVYHGVFRRMDAWQPAPEAATPGTQMHVRAYWCWGELIYLEAPDRAQRAVFERPLSVDVSAYDALTWHVSASAGRYVTLWAKVDGVWVHGEERCAGQGGPMDMSVPIAGKRLEALRVEAGELPGCTRLEPGHEIITIVQWVLGHRRGAPPYGPVWRRATHDTRPRQPAQDVLAAGVPFGFYFSRDDIPALREKIKSGPPARMWESIKNQANAALSAEPERWVDEFTHPSMAEFTPRDEPSVAYSSWITAPALAYVLTGDTRYADIARRGILTVCQIDWWGRGIPGRYPFGFSGNVGSQLNQSYTGMMVMQGYDWVSNTFTEEEHRLVREALQDKLYYWMWQSGVRYRDFSNRGAVYSWMLLQSAAILGDQAPQVAQGRAGSLSLLDDLVKGYFGHEGAGREGHGYGMGTLNLLVNIACAVAAEKKLPVAEYVAPTSLRHALEWFQWMRGTATSPPSYLNYSDSHYSGFSVGSPQALFYSHFFRDRQARWLWERQYAQSPPGDVRTLVWYDPDVTGEPRALPLTRMFIRDGFLFWRNGWQYGDTLLGFEGGPATRSGYDRNHFVLEAYGERLLLDPGICGYTDPEANLFKHSVRHNVITFDDEDQAQREGARAAVTTEYLPGEMVEFAESDATLAYARAKRVVRTMAFLRPEVFVISDVAEAPGPARISLNLNCGAPAHLQDGHTVLVEGARGRLRLEVISPPTVTAREHQYRTDTSSVTDYHLALSPPEATPSAHFVSVLVPSPARLPERVKVSRLECAAGCGVTITDGARDDVVLVASPGPVAQVSAPCLQARARMAVVTREAGRPRALAVLAGTSLQEGPGKAVTLSATAPVTLSAGYRPDGTVLVRARGAADTAVALPCPAAADKAWVLQADGTLAPLPCRFAEGLAHFALPPTAGEMPGTMLVLGTSAPRTTSTPPQLERVLVDGAPVTPSAEMRTLSDGAVPREVVVEVRSADGPLDADSVRLLADTVPVPRGESLRIEPIAGDRSHLRIVCLPLPYLRPTGTGGVASHVLTFQLATAALDARRSEFALTIGGRVPAREGTLYLSDLKPVEAFAHGGVMSDRGYWAPNLPLHLGGVEYAKGVTMHPETGKHASAVYDLSQRPTAVSGAPGRVLRAAVGITDEAGGGSAQFVVLLPDPAGGWKEVFRSRKLGCGDEPQQVSVPLGTATRLRLEVTDAGDGIGCDHATWADARLVPAEAAEH